MARWTGWLHIQVFVSCIKVGMFQGDQNTRFELKFPHSAKLITTTPYKYVILGT